MISATPYSQPDEKGNTQRAIDIANGIFYNKGCYHTRSDIDQIFSKSKLGNYLRSTGRKQNTKNGYSPVMYLQSGLGIKTGYLLFKNAVAMFYLARLFNLFVWLALIYFAIRVTPILKWQFCIFALLPKSIYVGMSVLCDSFVTAFSFLFFAYMFKLIFESKEKLSNIQISGYAILTFISAFLKGCLIYPAFLMLLVKDKRKIIISTLVITVCGLLGSIWIAANCIAYRDGVNPELNKYILFTKPHYFFRSVFLNTHWIIKMLDTMFINHGMYVKGASALSVIIYLLNFLYVPSEKEIRPSHRLMCMSIFFIYFITSSLFLYLNWTHCEIFTTAIPYHGRYFLPFLPCLFLIFTANPNNKDNVKFKIFIVCFILCHLIAASYYLLMRGFNIFYYL